jgi:hypothetical protein
VVSRYKFDPAKVAKRLDTLLAYENARTAARREHHWIQVANRRWCLGCTLFQQRPTRAHYWKPESPRYCPWDSAFAARQDADQPR